MEHFLLHAAHWVLKWGFTLVTIFSFVGMSKQLAQPLAPKTVKVGRGLVRRGTLDNVLDNTASMMTWIICLGITMALWMI